MIRLLLLLLPLWLMAEQEILITVEHATTIEQVRCGLMHRDHLPQNHGMLFHYSSPGVYRFWMMNCLIPLSVAFLDGNGVILAIEEMVAHPEFYDNTLNLNDLDYRNPDIKKFLNESILSPKGTQFVLEMEGRWFHKAGITPGDQVVWTYPSPRAKVVLRK